LPFVSNETRLLWETYSVAFQGWIATSRVRFVLFQTEVTTV
jgi:hypothetical protein